MKQLMVILGLIFCIPGFAQEINAEKSEVSFEISNMAVRTVEGKFTGMSGTINFDPNNLEESSFSVCIDASTVNTDNEERDEHLKNEDFFDVTKYPNICFESTSIEKTEDGFLAKGKMNLHGVTLEVEIPFTYADNTFTGNLSLNRLDYKVGEETTTFMVGNEAILTIVCVVN